MFSHRQHWTYSLVVAALSAGCSAAPSGTSSDLDTPSPSPVDPGRPPPRIEGNPTAFYTTYTPTGAKTPASVALDQEGKVSMTVKNQGTNGGCWGFADTAVIESEYISELHYNASTFALSEQYVIFNALRGYFGEQDLSGGNAVDDFQKIAAFGVPPAASYPNNLTGPWSALPEVVGPVEVVGNLIDPGYLKEYASTGNADSNWIADIGTYLGASAIGEDLARFNAATLAPLSVHEQAIYAPTSAKYLSFLSAPLPGGKINCLDPSAAKDTSVNCLNASPFEEVLSAGHTIKIEINNDPQQWNQNPTTGVFYYNPNGGPDGHEMALVGYNHANQTFRFKNSWGATWNGNGFGEMTYYNLMKVMSKASFVTSVQTPTAEGLGGGAWTGFWTARIGGNLGVAVLHSPSTDTIELGNGAHNPDTFQTSTSTLQLLPVQSGATGWSIAFGAASSAVGAGVADPFTLTRTTGAVTATYTDKKTGQTATWYKCDPSGLPFNIAPANYAAAAHDPYVLPPCGDTTWLTVTNDGQGSCPSGSTFEANGDCLTHTAPLYGVFWNEDYGYPAVSPASLGDWASGDYKGQCALGRPVTGVSRSINALESHMVECGPESINTSPSGLLGATCYARAATSSDNRGDTDNGKDWDPASYKTECASSEYVAGVSQSANGTLTSILCCAGTVAHNTCDTQVFYNDDSPAVTAPDWDPGYYKGQCPAGQYMAGISSPAYTSVGTPGAAHALLCCNP